MLTRRELLKAGLIAGGTLFLPGSRESSRTFAASVPTVVDPLYTQPIVDPLSIPMFVDSLPHPLAPNFILQPDSTAFPGADFYRVSMRQIMQAILPPAFPMTPVWAYGDPNNSATFSYPGHTIVARSTLAPVNASNLGRPVRVQYFHNELPHSHLLPVDTTVHCGPDSNGNETMCLPLVRTVVHLHGGHVGPESDGYPEAWSSPDGITGPFFNPNPFLYPNGQEATTLWFHDHALGITRLNVYAGLAAFYILRDDNEAQLAADGFLPQFPYEVPVVIQDRTFLPDGSFAYPDQPFAPPPTFDPWPGGPSIQPEFFGNTVVVNGKTWPFLNVEPRKYRIRFLNGSGSRFYGLWLADEKDKPGPAFHQIGSDGGFLNAPVLLNDPKDPKSPKLLLAPAERADVVIDFSAFAGETLILGNNAREPFPKGASPDPRTTGRIMAFRVVLPLNTAVPDTPLPDNLRPLLGPIPPLSANAPNRQLLLFEGTDKFGRLQPLLGTAAAGALDWFDEITEKPKLDDIEVWEVINPTPDTHPIHLHLVQFQIVNRQKFDLNSFVPGLPGTLKLIGNPKPPDANEAGWKDTARMSPGEVTRIIAKYDIPGLFAWHCHILEHEDHEMMRPYEVVT